MTQTSALESASITNLDATPVVYGDAGEGFPGFYRTVNDFVTALSADAIGSTYRIVRIPTNAKVKAVIVYSAAASAGAADIDVAYSDSTVDGTNISNQGSIIQVSAADNKLFGSAQTLVGLAASGTNVTFSNTFTQANSNQPLWEVLGLANDPGGRFDILLKNTTAITTGGVIAAKVDFVI